MITHSTYNDILQSNVITHLGILKNIVNFLNRMERKKYQSAITGMHCAACSSRIEKVVGNLEGVSRCAVNLATAKASIEYNDEIVSVHEIEESIKNLGFEAVGMGESNDMSAEDEISQQLGNLKKRLTPIFILATCIMLISMGPMVGITLPQVIAPDSSPLGHALLQFLLVIPVMLLGRNFYINGIPALVRGVPNMDTLIALGTGAAFIYSTWNLVEIYLGVEAVRRAHDLYFESAAMLIALISLGKYLEARSKVKTGEAIRALMELTPESATCIDEGGKQRVTLVALLQTGDNILLHPGERVAVDGVVVEGESYIDESMLTGESIPVGKRAGDALFGGTLNTTGTITFRATKVGSETVLSRIVALVQEAQGSKAPIASLADRVSLYFVPVVIAIALGAGFSWYFLGGADFSFSLRISIAVLVIACPCAMGLATPTSIMVGTGRGAQLGVLIKNGEVLERAKHVNCVVFDKTGTLTLGKPKLTEIVVFGESTKEEVLQLAAGVESYSEHPLATALLEAAEEKQISNAQVEAFEAVLGCGVKATMKNGGGSTSVILGNAQLLETEGVQTFPENYEKMFTRLSKEGKTVLHLALGGELLGLLAVSDPIKPEATEALTRLHNMGIKLVMLTGDNEKVSHKIADQAGIQKVVAGVLPEGKAAEIKRLQNSGSCVAMVGDGINDAPALAIADVGMAMGTGIDVAMESADIVLMNGNLQAVAKAIGLSRATLTNIYQNLFWAFIFNIIGIPVAAGVLTLFGGPALSPMVGGAAMAMSSVCVVTNALRLRFYGTKEKSLKA